MRRVRNDHGLCLFRWGPVPVCGKTVWPAPHGMIPVHAPARAEGPGITGGDTVPRMLSPSEHLLQFFKYEHLAPHLQAVSKPCAELAEQMDEEIPDGPEKTVGLRKLLEAKDCFVRAALAE